MGYDFSIKIDGAEIPPPSGYTFTESDLVVNSQRNAKGYANWDVVRENVGNLEMTWDNLDGERLSSVISAVRNKKTFNVTFFNPLIRIVETREFYSGDRAVELARFISAQRYWATLSVPFIEV